MGEQTATKPYHADYMSERHALENHPPASQISWCKTAWMYRSYVPYLASHADELT